MKQTELKIVITFFPLLLSLGSLSITQACARTTPTSSSSSSNCRPMSGQEIAPPLSRYNRASARVVDSQSSQSKNSQEKAIHQQEIEQAKAEKQRQIQALAANNKGVQLGSAGKFDEAIAAHEEAVELDPENKQYRINLSAAYCAYGQKLSANKDFAAAIHYSRKAIVAASDNALAGKLLIQSLSKMGINPNSAEQRLSLGDDLITQGDLGGAGIEYQAAEQLEQSGRTFVKLGDYAYRLGQIETAASWYNQASVKDPEYAPAYRQLAFIYIARQDQSQAASLLRKAVILDNKDKAAGVALIDLWRKQVSANPQIAENHLGLAASLQLTGDLAAAELEYRKVAALDPRNPSLTAAQASLKNAYQHAEAERHAEAANTLWGQNLRPEALTEMSQAVRIEPKNAQYQFSLAECLEANGDLQGAHQAYLTCVLIDPENNKEAAARIKALQDTSSKNNQNAVPASQNSVKQDTNIAQVPNSNNANNASDKNIILDKVQALEASRNYDQAIITLKELVSNNLENPEMHHHLAVDLMGNGDIGEAISEFRIASALAPTQKDYAADLAQALNINKQSLSNDKVPAVMTKSNPQLNTTIGANQ